MITPANFSPENTPSSTPDARQAGSSATRNSDVQSPDLRNGNSASEVDAATEIAESRLDSVGPGAANFGHDITDSAGADAIGFSLRQGILGEHGAAMLAQANLSSQSVLQLLQ
jgi:hypothetical protein